MVQIISGWTEPRTGQACGLWTGNPESRLKLASLSMQQLNTVDRNRNVLPTAEKAAAQIEAEANALKPQGLVMG